ncbi:MAG: DNA cytosine methyltransferase [Synergistaceae bacterium]|nr:DNA cytosine methyltransferase [Synergistaceae bacterium]
MNELTCVEICAGAGGQALGLERAGFRHSALVEYEPEYCEVLRLNRPVWNIICHDVRDFDGRKYHGADLLAGGVPCPPFSIAGKGLGQYDERDLFSEAVRLIREINPKAVMIENVRGFLSGRFSDYRREILSGIEAQGYTVFIKLVNASCFGVPQSRQRAVIVGIRNDQNTLFTYPEGDCGHIVTVGEALYDLAASDGWEGAEYWAAHADKPAPSIVGGSKKHGGPDLGPVRARQEWASMGVDGGSIADKAPCPGHEGMIRLTPRMIARLQGFPDTWEFTGKKTAVCRMIGNAFPPPVAEAVGRKIKECLIHE